MAKKKGEPPAKARPAPKKLNPFELKKKANKKFDVTGKRQGKTAGQKNVIQARQAAVDKVMRGMEPPCNRNEGLACSCSWPIWYLNLEPILCPCIHALLFRERRRCLLSTSCCARPTPSLTGGLGVRLHDRVCYNLAAHTLEHSVC